MKKLVPLSWYGGKASHLKWLLPIIEEVEYRTYVEPFGGSAAVLLNKKPSPIEVYNDIYSDVVNFFRVLRNRRDELLPLLELTPYSREEFAASCAKEIECDDLERARIFFVRARQVRIGLATAATPGRWSNSVRDARRDMAMVVSRWLSAIDGLTETCERLRHVQLEHLDGLDVIKRYDSESTLYYIDPPYLIKTRTGGVGYKHEFSEENHIDLLNLLKQIAGKVIISGYDNELYNNILKDWKRILPSSHSTAAARNNDKSLRQEVVWLNY